MVSAVLALVWIAATPVGAEERPEARRTLGDDLRVERLAEGLWLHQSDSSWGSRIVPANGLLLLGRDGILMVDTPWTEDQTARLLDWVTEELKAPVLGVFGTHFHPDAFGGIGEVHRRGIMTWGHTLTAGLAPEHDREVPRQTFDDRWSVSVGDEQVEAVYLGPGHAPDNFMVWFPARRILFAGCAVKALSWTSLGYAGDADLSRWPETLRAATKAFDAETVIPGHGSPGGPELLAHTLSLLAGKEDPAIGAGDGRAADRARGRDPGQ